MTPPLRFVVNVTRQKKGWEVTVELDGRGPVLQQPRVVPALDANGERYPDSGVQLHEPHALVTAAHAHEPLPALDAGTIAAMHKQISNRDASVAAIFGHYLFDALLGPDVWTAITAAAAKEKASTIELGLSWPAGDIDLNRLNWELMHSGDAFLAAGSANLQVAITRLVEPSEFVAARLLSDPPRVLFVIGAAMTDPAIRPAAELVGLLRQLNYKGRSIHHRVLEEAKPTAIRDAMASFRPDVVHFICHGIIDKAGVPLLQLQPDNPEEPRERGAEQLLDLLRIPPKQGGGPGQRPAIVVLSACHTGGGIGEAVTLTTGGQEIAPLATRLVQGGVPIVLAMAGRVSDLTCRLFTRRFGQAIIEGKSLVTAATYARRMTFAEGNDIGSSLDWALPAAFMSTAVEVDYRPIEAGGDTYWETITGWLQGYGLQAVEPVFCGRDQILHDYQLLWRSPDGSAPAVHVLPIYVNGGTSGCGRTRLLREIAAHAVRDGNIPVLVSFPSGKPPQTLADLGNRVDQAIDNIRLTTLELNILEASQLSLLGASLEEARADSRLQAEVKALLKYGDTVPATALRRAIQLDLEKLSQDARNKHPYLAERGGRPLVLLDDVEDYGCLQELLEQPSGLLGDVGLGVSGSRIPVVFTFSLGGNSNDLLEPITVNPRPGWLKARQLQPFLSENGEDMLAYESVLLTPVATPLDRAWAFDDRAHDELRGKWEGNFRKWLKGLPSNFVEPVLGVVVEWAAEAKFLIDADDAKVTKKYPEAQ